MNFIRLAATAVSAVVLCCCARTMASYEHYDSCAAQTASFIAMVECGKQKRTAYCQEKNECSPTGNSIVAYADSLATSVKAKQMTEAEAQRRWIEFKLARSESDRQAAIATAAAIAASGPTSCITTGTITTCH